MKADAARWAADTARLGSNDPHALLHAMETRFRAMGADLHAAIADAPG
jgi:hypothetical protein